jgi:hypothetical protein
MALEASDRAVASAICALALLWPSAAGAAVLPSPQGPSARNAAPIVPQGTRKPPPRPEPAPAASDHYAEPLECLPTWKI